MSEEPNIVDIELAFNGMVMTVCNKVEQCHPRSKFWMAWDDWPRLEMFLKMNQIDKVANKKIFGILVANRIIQLRQ